MGQDIHTELGASLELRPTARLPPSSATSARALTLSFTRQIKDVDHEVERADTMLQIANNKMKKLLQPLRFLVHCPPLRLLLTTPFVNVNVDAGAGWLCCIVVLCITAVTLFLLVIS